MYIEELYDKNGKPKMYDQLIEKEGDVESEVWDAIKILKEWKNEGEHGIPVEIWKKLGETMAGVVVKLCQ